MQQKKPKKRIFRIFLILFSILFVLATLTVIASALFIRSNFSFSVPIEQFESFCANLPPRFFRYEFSDRTNRVGKRIEIDSPTPASADTSYAELAELPKDLPNAFVAIEDKRFYRHSGVDWLRTASAGVHYVFSGSDGFGGSTITQQLVKNVTGDSEVTLRRKLQEILYARDLERMLSKEEILELYLNVISFSDGCNGVSEAARHYFSKSPAELTTAECATIAAITNNPTYYNPIRHPENNQRRRNLILSEMQKQGYLSKEEYETAAAEPLTLNVTSSASGEEVRSWYLDMVIEDVITDLCATYGMSRAVASKEVYSGGLQIDIAEDPEIQEIVEEYYRTSLSLPKSKTGHSAQSGLIVIDPATGDVLGVAGAVGKKTANRVQNFATQTLRSPGSVIKPITVYAPALEKGLITWSSVYDDVPVEFLEPDLSAWPRNAGAGYRGLTNIAYAVAHSTNTVAVRVLQKLGLDTSYRIASEQFHLNLVNGNGKSDRNAAALALGQLNYGVTLRELTDAYTVFADGGCYHPYRSYYRVLDRYGKVLLSSPDVSERVLSEGNAAVMTKLLQGVVESGTSSSLSLGNLCECAGKTGSTQNDCDRWFVGYTPDFLCGIWCGYEYPEPMSGGNPSIDIFNHVMQGILHTRPIKKQFDVPENVVKVSFCRDSGKLLSDACSYDPRGRREEAGWFVLGTEPKTHCDCHVKCESDALFGGILHDTSLPEEERKTVSLIRVNRSFPTVVTVKDAQYVYRGNPLFMPENPNSQKAYFDFSENGVFYGSSGVAQPFNRSALPRTPPEPEERIFEDGESPPEEPTPPPIPGNNPFLPRIE